MGIELERDKQGCVIAIDSVTKKEIGSVMTMGDVNREKTKHEILQEKVAALKKEKGIK